ncbi:MAG: hypothetical protein M9890_05005 [Thermomicrobiales bacterium]|nr:hypothetical protein [Thermomicrobiales bacterium]
MSTLLYGDNELLIDERVVQLRQSLDPQGLSAISIDVQSSTITEIASALQAAPFFGGQRVVILQQPLAIPRRGGDTAADEESAGRIPWGELHALLKSSPPTTFIILRHIGSLSPNHYVRKATKALAWSEEAFIVPRGGELLAWVTDRVRAQGAEIQPQAAQHLLTLLYPTSWQSAGGKNSGPTPDTRVIASEIDKLVTASDGVIDADLVALLVEDRGGFIAYRLTDLVFEGRVSPALQELERMLEAGEPAEKIMGSISSEAVVRAIVRHVREFGQPAVAAASATTTGRLTVTGKKPDLSDSANLRVAYLLREADTAIKAGHETASTIIVALVAQIAEAIRMSAGPRRRAY